MRSPARTKAPAASGKVTPSVAMTRAAPAVDHARTTGWRVHQLRAALPRPLASDTARTQEAVCAGLAPTATAAASTRASVEPKPTSEATRAAEKRDARNVLPQVPAARWRRRAGR
jgi:hypothetical protein